MSSVTLVESAKLSQDLLISGVIENIIDVNPFFQVLPFMDVEGNALSYNRQNAEGSVEWLGVNDTITAVEPATFNKITTSLTTLIGDAEVNGLIQATRSNITDQKATQVASKSRSLGREYQRELITGDGNDDKITGLATLATATQSIVAGANGAPLSFDLMDQLLDLVLDKDGEVDYIMMSLRTLRSYNALLRALGGASISETITLPSGKVIPAYRGTPIFKSSFVPVNVTQGTSTLNTTSVYAGTLDDGSGTMGISGLNSMTDSGIVIEELGKSHTKDSSLTRVKWYNGLALFNDVGLAKLVGINN